jgi:amino acid adenylation domain-containing protein
MESTGLPHSDENRCDSSKLGAAPSVASRYAGGLSPRVERCDHRIRQEDEFRIFERADIEQSIPARFAKQVRQYPDSVAVSWDGLRLTYEELNQEANRTACEILKRIGDAEEPVAFLLDHGGWAIAAILGILKAGKGYLALDPSFPRDRTAALLHDSTARLVVTEEKHLPLVGPIGREKTMFFPCRLGSQGSMDDPAVGIVPGRMATLYYTSGSTGEPKGVVQSHRNVLHNVMEMTNSGGLCPSDRLSLITSTAYAYAPTQIFGAICNGASLHPFNIKGGGIIHLADWMRKEKISWFFVTPSAFRRFADTLPGPESFPHLRYIVIGGELVQKRDVALYRKHFPDHCVLSVRLASSETERIRALEINKQTILEGDLVPVGYGVEDKEVLLLDDEGHAVGLMEVGEIAVKSRFLSPGYWNRPDLTSRCFIPDPSGDGRVMFLTGNLGLMRPDGCLEFRGRKDLQVKVRGFRVELGEVENALLCLDNVREAAAAAFDTAQGDKQLVAYIVPRGALAPDAGELRQSLRKTLPDYMIPAHFITLEQIPITTNGKVDRMRLPPPGDARPELATPYQAPRDELEACLAVIWEEILGIHPVGLKDRFDDLGADSLHYVNLIALIAKKLGMGFSLDRFVKEPTIEHLACLLHGPQREASPRVNVRDDTNPYRLVAYRGLEHNTPWKKTIKGVLFKLLSVFGDILPYGLASGMSASFCGTRLAQQHFFNHRARIMAQMLTAIETPMSREDALREFLVCRLLRDTRMAILARLGPSGFGRWVTVKGLPHLQQALNRGCGVILLDSHYGLPHFEMVILQRLGLENVLVIGGWPTQMQLVGIKHWRQIKMREDYEPAKRFMMGPIAMQAAREFLAAGGIVRMAPDGDVGVGGSSFPFWGRERTFRHGFANLVIDTAASALPTMVTLESSGRVQVEFFEPFDPGDVIESRKARVERLVMHYIRFLEGMWALHPGNVREADLQAFLAARPAHS